MLFLFKLLFKALENLDVRIKPETSEEIGERGEKRIYDKLARRFPKNQIFRNIYLKKRNGKYTEIDLILVTQKGLFVIESKNYGGWIFGSEHNDNWTQTFRGGQKHKFYNPIHLSHLVTGVHSWRYQKIPKMLLLCMCSTWSV